MPNTECRKPNTGSINPQSKIRIPQSNISAIQNLKSNTVDLPRRI
ncbi:hypothetical protein D1AOALGA4SA_6934 [Olavius algarvensis Delta 1 endosymbiont]|nr:hypothetical protein D1AOALGA4SA_6934 [Olavius algarvensis Delta 1 endosymbiont]